MGEELINYQQFISSHTIYASRKEASAKGFEAHHIVPKALQKNQDYFDDRCLRLTAFEHIYAHYLLALENTKAVPIFYRMVNYNFNSLSDIEKITLEQLEEWSKLREAGRKRMSEELKGKHSSLNTEWKKGHKPWNEGVLHSEETKKKMQENHKGMMGLYHSEETKQKIREGNLGKHREGYKAWNKGRRWFTNGSTDVFVFECPQGFKPGRNFKGKKVN